MVIFVGSQSRNSSRSKGRNHRKTDWLPIYPASFGLQPNPTSPGVAPAASNSNENASTPSPKDQAWRQYLKGGPLRPADSNL